jgi:hypothetical protein
VEERGLTGDVLSILFLVAKIRNIIKIQARSKLKKKNPPLVQLLLR